jgi:hypothetical protein
MAQQRGGHNHHHHISQQNQYRPNRDDRRVDTFKASDTDILLR